MKLTDGQYNLLVKIARMERELGGKPVHHIVRETEVGFSGHKTVRGARTETIDRLEELGFIHVEYDRGSDTRGGYTRYGTNTHAMPNAASRKKKRKPCIPRALRSSAAWHRRSRTKSTSR